MDRNTDKARINRCQGKNGNSYDKYMSFFFFEKNGTPWPPNRRGKRWEFTRLFRILGHVEVNGL